MKDELKKIVKKIIKYDNLTESGTFDEENFSIAMKRLIENEPELLEKDHGAGKRFDRDKFGSEIEKISDAYNYFALEVPKCGNKDIKYISEYNNFQSGTPLRWKPFPMSISCTKSCLRKGNLYLYPTNVGKLSCRKAFLEYLIREGFKIDKEDGYDGISVDNIAFTSSLTYAYGNIIKLIARPEDVVLITGPSYGLFAIESERYNARVEVLPLKEEDNWYVNSNDLSKKIDDINKKLDKKWNGKLDYKPKVVAFLNINPHNPIGNVMGKDNIDIIKGIGDVCLDKGVFVIDDLIYRDLGFDKNNLAVPMASIPKYFNNTITLMGISKAYSLASIRSGVVLAPIPIIRGLGTIIFQSMMSTSVLQTEALKGAFNGSNKRYRIYNRYFSKLIPEYKYLLSLLEALIDGIDSIKDNNLKNRIISDIRYYEKDEKILKKLYEGVPNVSLRKGTRPQSGFFAVLDFTKLKGKKYKDIVINNDKDMYKYIYLKGKVSYIMGQSMAWPNNDEIIARITYALEKDKIIHNMKVINLAVRDLL